MIEKDAHHRKAIRALFDDVKAELGWAVQDIRHEVVERGWFDREVTPESVHTLGNPFEQEPQNEAEREADIEPEQDLER